MALAPKPTPPFAALRAFHAVATHDRYRDAAASLGITESAVSHQVRKLEKFLQTALIDRSGPRAVLTETGRRYFDQIDPAIRQIQAATEALLPASGRSAVRLTLPPSLAAAWLIPKLGAFEAENPSFDLQLITTTRVIDLRRDQVDLAIRLGKGQWPGVDAEFLLAETAMPVCAPAYLEQLGIAPDAEAAPTLQGARLIINASFPAEWEEWARARGMPPPDLKGAVTLDSMAQALQVAESGHAIAMGRQPVVDDLLARGALIAPFGKADPTGAGYYLCSPHGQTPTAAVRRLVRWLHSVAPPRDGMT
jgi:LysR family glycine cleavage system transcriptional activator